MTTNPTPEAPPENKAPDCKVLAEVRAAFKLLGLSKRALVERIKDPTELNPEVHLKFLDVLGITNE